MRHTERPRLKHVIRYDAYAIFEADDGSFVAEPSYPDDSFQVTSRDIRQLCAALDAIEDALVCHAADRPDWLKRHLASPDDVVVLPSALAPETACAAALRHLADAPPSRTIRIRRSVSATTVHKMMRAGRLWELMPNGIERRFLIHAEA